MLAELEDEDSNDIEHENSEAGHIHQTPSHTFDENSRIRLGGALFYCTNMA